MCDKSWKCAEKTLWQHCQTCADNFVNRKTVLGPQAEPFWKRKNHWNFHFVRARLSAALCGCDWWDSFPWQCRHRCMRVCSPLTANMFPGWSTSIYTCFSIFLASFAPRCPILILVQKGNCGRKPLTLCLFWRVSKKSSKIQIVCHADANPPTTKKTTGGNAVHLLTLRTANAATQKSNATRNLRWTINF